MSKEMTPKDKLEKLTTKQIAIDLFNIVSNGKYDMNNLVNYFDRIDEALAELEELKRDVRRYFELWEQAREKWGNGLNDVEAYEATKLHIKLSKVGNEE